MLKKTSSSSNRGDGTRLNNQEKRLNNQEKHSAHGLVPSPKSSGRRARLRLWKLKNKEEEAALRQMDSGLRGKRGFRRVVLAHLQLIADTVSLAAKEKDLKPREPKPSATRRALEHRVQSVKGFVHKMEKPLSTKADGLSLLLPLPPIRELRQYADDLEDCGRRLKRDTRSYPPRNRPRPETREIVKLVKFVKGITGKSFLGSLAVLLRRPTRVEYNKASLRQLVKFWLKKRASRRVHFPPKQEHHRHFPKPRTGFPPTQ
jgi:hypothetical protein